jgi:hypothetical protein
MATLAGAPSQAITIVILVAIPDAFFIEWNGSLVNVTVNRASRAAVSLEKNI